MGTVYLNVGAAVAFGLSIVLSLVVPLPNAVGGMFGGFIVALAMSVTHYMRESKK